MVGSLLEELSAESRNRLQRSLDKLPSANFEFRALKTGVDTGKKTGVDAGKKTKLLSDLSLMSASELRGLCAWPPGQASTPHTTRCLLGFMVPSAATPVQCVA